MINSLVSVVTVTYNNKLGLESTLNSLCGCSCKPFEVIIIDGGSNDGTQEIITNYENKLVINFISEPDTGIYNAMNKGLREVKTPLVHYLNSGDMAAGDIYLNCIKPALLPVKIFDPANGSSWIDKVKLFGYGYCHQGIIFPSSHPPFNESLTIAADFETICKTFKNGLHLLPLCNNGYVVYGLGGISSIKSGVGNREIVSVANNQLSKFLYLKILIYITAKSLLPRPIRRFLVKTNTERI